MVKSILVPGPQVAWHYIHTDTQSLKPYICGVVYFNAAFL